MSNTLMAAFSDTVDSMVGPHIGDRVRFKRPRSTVWREGTVKRYSYSRTGKSLLQVKVDTVDGGHLTIASTARIAADNVEIVSRANSTITSS